MSDFHLIEKIKFEAGVSYLEVYNTPTGLLYRTTVIKETQPEDETTQNFSTSVSALHVVGEYYNKDADEIVITSRLM